MASPARDVRICFFGDSFLNGTGDASHLGWSGRACAALPLQSPLARGTARFDVTHYNLGIRGNTSLDIEQRWQEEAARRWKPGTENRLFFSFGTNDGSLENGLPRVPLSESVRSAEASLRRAKQTCPVLFSGPPAAELEARDAAFARLEALSHAYAELASALEVPYLDLFSLTRECDAWHAAVARGDGVHPDAAGYELLGSFVTNWKAWQAWW